MLGPLDENRLAKEIEKEPPERSKTEGIWNTLGIKGIESCRRWEWCFESLKGDQYAVESFLHRIRGQLYPSAAQPSIYPQKISWEFCGTMNSIYLKKVLHNITIIL